MATKSKTKAAKSKTAKSKTKPANKPKKSPCTPTIPKAPPPVPTPAAPADPRSTLAPQAPAKAAPLAPLAPPAPKTQVTPPSAPAKSKAAPKPKRKAKARVIGTVVPKALGEGRVGNAEDFTAPQVGSVKGRVWAWCDEFLRANKRHPLRYEVLDAAGKAKPAMSKGSAATYYQEWALSHGAPSQRPRA